MGRNFLLPALQILPAEKKESIAVTVNAVTYLGNGVTLCGNIGAHLCGVKTLSPIKNLFNT